MRFIKILMRWALISLIVACTRAEVLSTFDANGNSQVVWSDDGSYGVQVFNKVDGDGRVYIIEYSKVTDSNFVRDSFTFNTDYTRSSLNEVFGIVGVDTNNIYAVGLSSGGTLDNGNGWSLVDNGDGTHNVNNSGGLPGLDYKIPVQDDYVVRETSMLASNITNGIIVNDILVNAEPEPYLQIVTQKPTEWNLREQSETGFSQLNSTGINGYGIGITASLITELVPVQLSGRMIQFSTSTNERYLICSTTNLTSNHWMIETNFIGSGTTNTFEMLPLYTNQFFKVEELH